jgi:hypothetical protein
MRFLLIFQEIGGISKTRNRFILNIIQDRGKRKLPLDDVYRQLVRHDS